jgi:glycosyltransferase involved in cell wall biosynthesis
MRILHVLPGMAPGGMEQLVIALSADAGKHGDEVVVVAGPGAWTGRLAEAGATHVALPVTTRASTASVAAAIGRLARCARQFRPQVVHAHNVRAAAMARLALAAARHDAALLATLHGVPPGDYRAASRVLSVASPRVIACAPAVARSLCAAGYPCSRIDVIVNGAALQPASPQRQAALRRELGIGTEPLVAGIGRLTEQKNWPVLIAAAAHLPHARIVVAGDGPLRQELASLARRSGDRVTFAGPIDDIAALVGICSCVVSTSSWEGLPLAVLEALSLGAPVVATAVDGITDIVPPEAAALVPPDDPAAVATQISHILADGRQALSLRRNALAACGAWHPEQMLRKYRLAYEQAVASRPSPRIAALLGASMTEDASRPPL